MQENIFNPMAEEMRLLFEALFYAGFTEQQAFELTKTYCSIAFVNQALNVERYSYRSKRESYERLRKNISELKEKETTENA